MFDNLPQKPEINRATNTMVNTMSSPLLRGKWLDDADEVFTYLERHNVEKDSWWQSMNVTLNLLKKAHRLIMQSEMRIKEQEERIQTLEKLSNTDELTGILNRRGFMHEFARELDRVNRDKSQGGLLIMIDLDNFKAINDTHGHDAGDAALRLVGTTLNTDIRTMDVAGRLGGDEFVILFVNTDRKQALERAQFLIKKMNNLSFIWAGHEIPVRASLGLKEYKKGSKAEHIFSAADESMYESKRQNKEDQSKTG